MKTIKYQITSEAAYQWVGWCEQEGHKLDKLRKPDSMVRKYYQFPNNITAEITVTNLGITIRMWMDLSGVILHPRSGTIQQIPYTEYVNVPGVGSSATTKSTSGVIGGWRNGKTLLTTAYPFPLDDTDDASFIVTSDSVNESGEPILQGKFAEEDSLYGNLYWTNGDTVLSWRGTPTRHFSLSTDINLPGFSILEDVVLGDIEEVYYYTPFGTKVYQEGGVLYEAPKYNWPNNGPDRCLILGAMQNTEGVIYIVTQSNRRNAPDGVNKPGYYLMLWRLSTPDDEDIVVDGWKLISEYNYGRSYLPWFGNTSGNMFICSNGATLDADGVLNLNTPITGTYQEALDSGNWNLNIKYTSNQYFEFKNNEVVKGALTCNVISNETSSGTTKPDMIYTSNTAGLFSLADAVAIARIPWDGTAATVGTIGDIICIDGEDWELTTIYWFPWDTTTGPTHWATSHSSTNYTLSYFSYYADCFTDRDVLPYPYNDPELYPNGYCAPYNVVWYYTKVSPYAGC